MMIPCLCSFTALRALAAEPPTGALIAPAAAVPCFRVLYRPRLRRCIRCSSRQCFLGRRSYGSRNRGLSNRPPDGLLTALRAAALFSSCTVHHKTVVISVDVPRHHQPRTKKQSTGLLFALPAAVPCFRVLYRPRLQRKLAADATKKPLT